MNKRTREIIALGIMGLLAVVLFSAMAWYIMWGHNWNITASNIDETIGQMEGYSVFLVKGNKNPSLRALSDPGETTESFEEKPLTETESEVVNQEIPKGTFEDLIESYENKGAKVYVLDDERRSFLSDAGVVTKGDRRVGFVAFQSPPNLAQAKGALNLLAKHKPDFIVGFATEQGFDKLSLPLLDLAIVDNQTMAWEPSFSSNGTFYVTVPYLGQAEAIIRGPSGILLSKILEIS